MSIALSMTVPVVGDTIKNDKLAKCDVKSSKAYIRGEDSTDDQAYSSTDEGSFNSDGDSSHSSSKKTLSVMNSASPSRRGSNATDEDVAGNITELLPSVGSAGHFKGECSRCCFFPKGRCNNGKNCGFCHFDHDRRPRRSKRGGNKNKAEDESTTASSEGSDKAELLCEPVVAEPVVSVKVEEPAAPAPVTIKPAAPAPGLSTPVNSCKPMTLPLPVPAFQPMGVMQSARSYYVPTPMGYNSARFSPMPATLPPQDGADAVQIKQFSGGRPVKVWLPESTCTNKQLKPTIPAKKRPPYSEFITTSRPALDPQQPVKKRVPVFSESFLEDILRQPLEFANQPLAFASAMPAVVEAPKPTVLVPR